MSQDILQGVIGYVQKEIERRVKEATDRIVGEVIADTMNRLHIQINNHPEDRRTEVVFIFEKD